MEKVNETLTLRTKQYRRNQEHSRQHHWISTNQWRILSLFLVNIFFLKYYILCSLHIQSEQRTILNIAYCARLGREKLFCKY